MKALFRQDNPKTGGNQVMVTTGSRLNCTHLTVMKAQGFPACVGGPPAVDDECMPVDEPAQICVGKKCDRLGDIIRRSKSCHRYTVGDVSVGIASGSLVSLIHFAFDPPGAHGIDPHASPAPLGSQC